MDHLEHTVRLSEESEHKSLYQWFLQEVTKDGAAHGPRVVPWAWTLWFRASAIEYRRTVAIKEAPDAEENPRAEMIRATLCPEPKFPRAGRPVRFSMLGTDRDINDFSLRVLRLPSGQTREKCKVWGIVSYTTEIDFRDTTQEDCIEIEVSLHAKNFDELRGLIQNGRVDDQLIVSLSCVAGFYSEWSPSISADRIKVLTGKNVHPLISVEGSAIKPPRLGGAVGEWGLMFDRRTATTVPKDSEEEERQAAERVEAEAAALVAAAQSSPERGRPDPTIFALAQVQQGVKQLRTVLWVIAVLIAACLLARWA